MRSLVILLAHWLLIAAPGSAEPAMEMSIDHFDFGHVANRTTLYYTVWFRSTGTDTLKILDIKTGCDCAIMPATERRVPPGDSVSATLVWDVERSHGLVRRFPRVFTNASPDPGRLTFEAMALAHPDSARPVRIMPYRFVFSNFMGKTRDSIAFTLTNLGPDDYKVLLPTPVSDHYELVIPDSLAAGATAQGFIRLKDALIGEEFDATLTLQFDTKGKDPHRLSVPVRHEIYTP